MTLTIPNAEKYFRTLTPKEVANILVKEGAIDLKEGQTAKEAVEWKGGLYMGIYEDMKVGYKTEAVCVNEPIFRLEEICKYIPQAVCWVEDKDKANRKVLLLVK